MKDDEAIIYVRRRHKFVRLLANAHVRTMVTWYPILDVTHPLNWPKEVGT